MKDWDNIFKKGLENKGIQYKEEYWEEMENMLNSKNAKYIPSWSLKRGFFLIGAILLLLFFTRLLFEGNYRQTVSSMSKLNPSTIEIEGGKKKDKIALKTDSAPKTKVTSHHPNTHTIKSYPLINPNPELGGTDAQKEESKVKGYQSQIQFPILKNLKETGLFTPLLFQSKQRFPKQLLTPLYLGNNTIKERSPKESKTSSLEASKWFYYFGLNLEMLDYRKANYAGIQLKNQEAPQPSYEVNIFFTARKKKVRFGLGLGLKHLEEKTNYQELISNWSYDTSYVLIQRQHQQNPDGSWTALIKRNVDSTDHPTKLEHCNNCKTTFDYITIPANVQYELALKKWGLFGSLGITANILVKQQGLYTSKTGGFSVVDLNTTQEMKPLYFQSNIATGIRYKLGAGFSLKGSIGYQVSLNSTMRSFEQKPWFRTFGFGIEYKL